MTKLILILAIGDAMWALINIVTSTIIMFNESIGLVTFFPFDPVSGLKLPALCWCKSFLTIFCNLHSCGNWLYCNTSTVDGTLSTRTSKQMSLKHFHFLVCRSSFVAKVSLSSALVVLFIVSVFSFVLVSIFSLRLFVTFIGPLFRSALVCYVYLFLLLALLCLLFLFLASHLFVTFIVSILALSLFFVIFTISHILSGLMLSFYANDQPFRKDDNGWCMPERSYHLYGWIIPIAVISVYILVAFMTSIIIYGTSNATVSHAIN